MDYDNPWIFEGKIFSSDDIAEYYAFVYELHNVANGKKYIGKKFFYSQKTKIVKGKKKKSIAESDWKDYYGSNRKLLADIEIHGKESIERKILKLCKNKTSANYFEMKEQIEKNALLDDTYYNEFIGSRISGKFIYE